MNSQGKTLSQQGCVITGLANHLADMNRQVNEQDINPKVLLEYLNQHKGLMSDSKMVWQKLEPLFGDGSKCDGQKYGSDAARQTMANDGKCLISISGSNGGEHYLTANSYDSNGFFVSDPADANRTYIKNQDVRNVRCYVKG